MSLRIVGITVGSVSTVDGKQVGGGACVSNPTDCCDSGSGSQSGSGGAPTGPCPDGTQPSSSIVTAVEGNFGSGVENAVGSVVADPDVPLLFFGSLTAPSFEMVLTVSSTDGSTWRLSGSVTAPALADVLYFDVPTSVVGGYLAGSVAVPGFDSIDVLAENPCNGSGPLPPAPTCNDVTPGSLPSSLSWEVTAATGLAICALGLSGTMTQILPDPGRTWESPFFDPCDKNTQNLSFRCQDDQYTMGAVTTYDGCPPGTPARIPPVTGTASPFTVTFILPACWFRDATGNESDTVTVKVSA